jgi:hypothetical protein
VRNIALQQQCRFSRIAKNARQAAWMLARVT